MRTLHLLPTFHHDIAYLRRCDEYLVDCEKILDEALRILADDSDYTFMVEQVFLLDWYWEKRPDQRDTLKRFYNEGRLTIAPGMWTVPDLNLPDGESFLQQIRIGKEWIAQKLGGTRDEPRICWIADCWGHPPQMPQLARLSGYSGYIFWRCMKREFQQADFVWRGLDGSEIDARWMARGYANLRFPTDAEAVNAAELRFSNTSAGSLAGLVEQLDSYSTQGTASEQLICNGGDMAFPQASAPAVTRRLSEAGLPLRFSSLDAFFKARATTSGVSLPLTEGEFNSALTGTFTSNIRLKLANRACTERLLALEKLAVFRERKIDFVPLWKMLLKQQFHDTICGTLCDGALQDALDEFAALERDISKAEKRISGSDTCPAPGGWFNACDFARTVWLPSIDNNTPPSPPPPPALIKLPAHGETPANTAIALHGVSGSPPPETFETPHYRVRFNRQGFITSLVEAHTGSECVCAQPIPFGAIAMVPDYGDLWLNHEGPLNGGSFESSLTQNHPDPLRRGKSDGTCGYGPHLPAITEVRVLFHGPEALIFEQRGRISFWRQFVEFTTTVKLCAALPRIEYRTRLTPHGKDFRLRAVFGTPFTDGEARFEVPFGIVTRETGEHAAQRFVDLRDRNGKAGLAILNRGTSGHAIDDGAILMSLFRSVAMDYKAPSDLSCADGIEHVFDYAIQPHAGLATDELVRAGADFNSPPIPLAKAKLRNECFTLKNIKTDSVRITSLRSTNDADNSVCLRLVEMAGTMSDVTLSLPENVTKWASADALGRRTDEWQSIAGDWKGKLAAHQICTLLLKKS